MSLRFCFGPSGAGKSHRIYEEIMQRAAQEPGRNDHCAGSIHHADPEGSGHAQ